MDQSRELRELGVLDVLRNPLGGPHWLPADYSYTPLPETQRPPSPPTPPPEYISTSPPPYELKEQDFLRENGHLFLRDGDELNSSMEKKPDPELVEEYLEWKTQQYGETQGEDVSEANEVKSQIATIYKHWTLRQFIKTVYQNESKAGTIETATSALPTSAEETTPDVRNTKESLDSQPRPPSFIDFLKKRLHRLGEEPRRNEPESGKGETVASALYTSTKESNLAAPGVSKPVTSALRLPAVAILERDKGPQGGPEHSVSSQPTSHPINGEVSQQPPSEPSNMPHLAKPDGPSSENRTLHDHEAGRRKIKQEWPTTDFERDLKAFIDASRPDREFWEDVERPSNSSRVGQPWEKEEADPKPDQPKRRQSKGKSVDLADGKKMSPQENSNKGLSEKCDKEVDEDSTHAGSRPINKRVEFRNPYTGAWLTRRECHLIWAILRKVLTAPHHGFRRIWTTYNRSLLDMMFTDIIRDQRQTWWVRAEGGHHIPPTAKVDCRRVVDALQETPNPKFCSLKSDVDKDPVGGYWDRNAAYAVDQWIESRKPWFGRHRPPEMVAPSKSDPANSVERAVLKPLLNDDTDQYWDRVMPKRTTFLDSIDEEPIAPTDYYKKKQEQAAQIEKDDWVQTRFGEIDLFSRESALEKSQRVLQEMAQIERDDWAQSRLLVSNLDSGEPVREDWRQEMARIGQVETYSWAQSCPSEASLDSKESASQGPASPEPASSSPEPVLTEPASTSPDPTPSKPASTRPASTEPTSTEPVSSKPASNTPTSSEPASDEATPSDEPISSESASNQPVSTEPASNEPVSDQPAFNADEVREALKQAARDGPSVKYVAPNRTYGPSPAPGTMADGENFFLELRKQVTALQVEQQEGQKVRSQTKGKGKGEGKGREMS